MAAQPYLIHTDYLFGIRGGSVLLSDFATKGGLSIH